MLNIQTLGVLISCSNSKNVQELCISEVLSA